MNFLEINLKDACFNFRKAARAITKFYDHNLEPIGLRSTQFSILIELDSCRGKHLSKIAEDLVMDRTTLTRNLSPLIKQDFAKIVSLGGEDVRKRSCMLTEKGRKVLEEAIPLWDKAQKHILEKLGKERYRSLLGELNLVRSWAMEG